MEPVFEAATSLPLLITFLPSRARVTNPTEVILLGILLTLHETTSAGLQILNDKGKGSKQEIIDKTGENNFVELWSNFFYSLLVFVVALAHAHTLANLGRIVS